MFKISKFSPLKRLNLKSLDQFNHEPSRIQVQKRTVYEQTRSGSVEFEKKKRSHMNEPERLKLAVKMAKFDTERVWQRMKDSSFHMFRSDTGIIPFDDRQLIKMYDFDQRNNDKLSSYDLDYKLDKKNDMNNWLVTCDSDYDIGFSKCSWSVSPSGYALFSGYLDKTVPKDGRTVRAGYAYLSCHKRREPFGWLDDGRSIFEEFTHVVMRVRGDGRLYHIAFDTSDLYDITWFDRYQYPLYSFGGPYWQYVKIPFSRFVFHYQGYIQDEQYEFNPNMIKSMGIFVTGTCSGPFRLEIDYIGFLEDSQHNDTQEYEGYYHESGDMKTL